MSSTEVCPCGIAKADCDYHKPATKEYFAGKVYKDMEIMVNPFFSNNMVKRAEFITKYPNLVDSAVKAAGLTTPWELHKT